MPKGSSLCSPYRSHEQAGPWRDVRPKAAPCESAAGIVACNQGLLSVLHSGAKNRGMSVAAGGGFPRSWRALSCRRNRTALQPELLAKAVQWTIMLQLAQQQRGRSSHSQRGSGCRGCDQLPPSSSCCRARCPILRIRRGSSLARQRARMSAPAASSTGLRAGSRPAMECLHSITGSLNWTISNQLKSLPVHTSRLRQLHLQVCW